MNEEQLPFPFTLEVIFAIAVCALALPWWRNQSPARHFIGLIHFMFFLNRLRTQWQNSPSTYWPRNGWPRTTHYLFSWQSWETGWRYIFLLSRLLLGFWNALIIITFIARNSHLENVWVTFNHFFKFYWLLLDVVLAHQ